MSLIHADPFYRWDIIGETEQAIPVKKRRLWCQVANSSSCWKWYRYGFWRFSKYVRLWRFRFPDILPVCIRGRRCWRIRRRNPSLLTEWSAIISGSVFWISSIWAVFECTLHRATRGTIRSVVLNLAAILQIVRVLRRRSAHRAFFAKANSSPLCRQVLSTSAPITVTKDWSWTLPAEKWIDVRMTGTGRARNPKNVAWSQTRGSVRECAVWTTRWTDCGASCHTIRPNDA